METLKQKHVQEDIHTSTNGMVFFFKNCYVCSNESMMTMIAWCSYCLFFWGGGRVWGPKNSSFQSLIAWQSFVCCQSMAKISTEKLWGSNHTASCPYENIYIYICNIQIISNTHIHLPVTLMNMSKIPETKKHWKKHESISILKSVFFVFFGPLLLFRAVLPGVQESKVINWNKVSMESSTSPKRIWSRRLDGPFGWGMVVGWGWASATVLGVKTLQVGCGNLTNSPLGCSYKWRISMEKGYVLPRWKPYNLSHM